MVKRHFRSLTRVCTQVSSCWSSSHGRSTLTSFAPLNSVAYASTSALNAPPRRQHPAPSPQRSVPGCIEGAVSGSFLC
jgi:hypothetical protein